MYQLPITLQRRDIYLCTCYVTTALYQSNLQRQQYVANIVTTTCVCAQTKVASHRLLYHVLHKSPKISG